MELSEMIRDLKVLLAVLFSVFITTWLFYTVQLMDRIKDLEDKIVSDRIVYVGDAMYSCEEVDR